MTEGEKDGIRRNMRHVEGQLRAGGKSPQEARELARNAALQADREARR